MASQFLSTLNIDAQTLIRQLTSLTSMATGRSDIVSGPYWFAAPSYEPHSFRANEGADNYLHSNSDLTYDVDGDGWISSSARGGGGHRLVQESRPKGAPGGASVEEASVDADKGKDRENRPARLRRRWRSRDSHDVVRQAGAIGGLPPDERPE
jgi:hypothetical protein